MWEKHQDSHLQKIKNSNKKSSQSYYCDCGRQILQRGPGERQAMEDTKWLWFGTTSVISSSYFPTFLHSFKPQVHRVIQAQRKDNANICLSLTPETGLQATSGYPVWMNVDWTSPGRLRISQQPGHLLLCKSPIQLNQLKEKATSVSFRTEQKPLVFDSAWWVSVCTQKRDQNGNLRKFFPKAQTPPRLQGEHPKGESFNMVS